MAVYFSSVSTITIDYSLTKYYDEGFFAFYLWAFFWSVFGSVICIVLNFFLILCVFTIEDFKNWTFFPVCLQAAIDIAGPGFANIIYNVMSFSLLRGDWDYVDYFLPEDFVKFTFVTGNQGCFLTIFRSILNEYTTGLCVLASAFFRYCLVCHPAARVMSQENLKKISLTLVLAIMIILIANFLDMAVLGRQTSSLFNTTTMRGWTKFVWNCSNFTFRNNIRRPILCRDIVLFFCVPASVSAYFYLRIFRVLRARERNQNRNKNLIVAFVLNWVLWIVCWTLYYTSMSIKLGYKTTNKLVSERTMRDVLKERLAMSKDSFFLLYSQLNPVFFLIILKPFQKKLLEILKIALSSNEQQYGVIKNHKNHVSKLTTLKFERARDGKLVLKRKFRSFGVTLLLLAVFSIFFIAVLSVDIDARSTQAKDNLFASKRETRIVEKRQVPRFLFFRDAFSAEFEDPRLKCGLLKGSFSMKKERCYFAAKFNKEKGLNLTEQAEFCRSKNATLAYARGYDDVGFLFRFYLFECGPDCRKNVTFEGNRWFIRLGFQKIMIGSWSGFTTFDGNLVVEVNRELSSRNNNSVDVGSISMNGSVNDGDYDYAYDYENQYDYEYDYDYDYNYDYVYDYDYQNWKPSDYYYVESLLKDKPFQTPAVCLTYRTKLFPCLARTKLQVAVCMFEFSSIRHLPFKNSHADSE